MKLTNLASTGSLLMVGLGLAVNGYSQYFLTDGLVAYYPFNGSAQNAMGNGLDGTVQGATLTNDGMPRPAYAFNGNNTCITIADPAAMLSFDARSNNYTLATWVKLTTTQSTGGRYQQIYVDRGAIERAPVCMDLRFDTEVQRFFADVWDGSTGPTVTNTTQPVAGVWYHVALSVSNRTIRLFVNGVDETQPMYWGGVVPTTFGSTKNTDPVRNIGRWCGDGRCDSYFNGIIDEVRIYNRALSSSEVRDLYKYRSLNLNAGLVAYHPFNGNANDESGNGNNGTVQGATLTNDGMPGPAYAFNGNNTCITIADPAAMLSFDARSNNYTLATWVKLTTTSSTGGRYQQIYVDRGAIERAPVCMDLRFDTEVQRFFADVWDGSTSPTVTNTTQPVAGVWYHLAMSVSNRTIRLFVNGVDETQPMYWGGVVPTTFGSTKNTDPIRNIGRWCGDGRCDSYFNGIIDEIRIYNRALSPDEVQQLYLYDALPVLNVKKAIYLDSPNLKVGTNYQLQVSSDLSTWTNYGAPFTATNSTWRTTNYWDVDNWSELFFRLQVSP